MYFNRPINAINNKLNKKIFVIVVFVLFFLITAYSSFYTIDAQEEGLVLRFQKMVDIKGPGLHFKIPYIESIIKVPVQSQLKEEFGFRTIKAGVKTEYDPKNYLNESLMLTKDLNVVKVEWSTQYRIKNPYLSVFKIRNCRETFRDLNEAVMRHIIGQHSVDDALTVGRATIANEAKVQLQKLCNKYETGIEVIQLVIQEVLPPDSVAPAFNEVNQALQEKEKLINEAWAEYNQVIPEAKGKAEKTIKEAKGYYQSRINHAKGDIASFLAVEAEYKKYPKITADRLYYETIQSIFQNPREIIIISNSGNLLKLLNLQK